MTANIVAFIPHAKIYQKSRKSAINYYHSQSKCYRNLLFRNKKYLL